MEIDKEVVKRFTDYVKIDTQSDPESDSCPSTANQFVLAKLLEQELNAIGVQNVHLSSKCYLYACLPSNSKRNIPPIGFIAHLDTSPDVSGTNVNPVMETDANGQIIIKSDGTTLLGADDKAGIAEIMTSLAYLSANKNMEHGDIYVAFTPDEEIGRGADFFDLERFKAAWAYTMDGGEIGEFSYENFNAAEAEILIKGKNTHPGSAKGLMCNSLIVAAEIMHTLNDVLPSPEKSEGREGFVHTHYLNGNVEESVMHCLIRDFDKIEFEKKKTDLTDIIKNTAARFADATVEIRIRDQYYNMIDVIKKYPHTCTVAIEAMKSAGIKPRISPTRGGTDGSRLSFMGLPCPNIFAGGLNFHSRDEYIPVESMTAAVNCILGIICRTSYLTLDE